MTWLAAEKLLMSNPARRRKRAPIGGYCAPVRLEARWRAGQTKGRCGCGAGKRGGGGGSPAATSSYRTRPGNTGRPAASVEVHPEGRRALERRLKMAPDPAIQLAACGYAE